MYYLNLVFNMREFKDVFFIFQSVGIGLANQNSGNLGKATKTISPVNNDNPGHKGGCAIHKVCTLPNQPGLINTPV